MKKQIAVYVYDNKYPTISSADATNCRVYYVDEAAYNQIVSATTTAIFKDIKTKLEVGLRPGIDPSELFKIVWQQVIDMDRKLRSR